MKIILSFFILFIPFSLSGKEVCMGLGGCKIIWETGKCVGCIERKVIPKKYVDTFTPVVNVFSLTTTSKVSNTNTNPHYKTYYEPDYNPEIKVVDTPTLDNGGNVILHDNYQRGYPTHPHQNTLTHPIHDSFQTSSSSSEMVLVSPIGKTPFYVKRSEMGVPRCKSGCITSRCSTLGLLCEGKYWRHKDR